MRLWVWLLLVTFVGISAAFLVTMLANRLSDDTKPPFEVWFPVPDAYVVLTKHSSEFGGTHVYHCGGIPKSRVVKAFLAAGYQVPATAGHDEVYVKGEKGEFGPFSSLRIRRGKVTITDEYNTKETSDVACDNIRLQQLVEALYWGE